MPKRSSRRTTYTAGRRTTYVPPKPASAPYVPDHLLQAQIKDIEYYGGISPEQRLAQPKPNTVPAYLERINAPFKKEPLAPAREPTVMDAIVSAMPTGDQLLGNLPRSINAALLRTGLKKPPGLYDKIGTDTRRTYGLGTALQQKILTYKDAMQAPSDRYFGPKPDPYSDDVPRLYDYSQQGEKFGSFEDYQKAVEARQHGFVPNDYEDLPSGLGTDEDGSGDGTGVAGGGGGYPYYPGSQAKAGYNPGARPNWRLWATVIQETTWNI